MYVALLFKALRKEVLLYNAGETFFICSINHNWTSLFADYNEYNNV